MLFINIILPRSKFHYNENKNYKIVCVKNSAIIGADKIIACSVII